MTDQQATKLGALIRRGRRRKGLSLFALADLTGFDDSWLARLEKGHYASPNPAHLARVAETLDIDPARIDVISRDHLADAMPTMRTYFRSKEKLSPAALDELERAVARIRAKHAGDSPATEESS